MMNAKAWDKKALYLSVLLTLAFLLPIFNLPERYSGWSAAAVLSVSAAAIYFCVRKRSIHSYNKQTILLMTAMAALLYLTLYYVSGIYFSFGIINTDMALIERISYIASITIIILATELIRVILLGHKGWLVSLCVYAIGVISELFVAGGISGLDTAYRFMDFVGMTLFPALASNLLFNYLARRYGMLPNLAYRLILSIYVYIVPIISNAPQILSSFALIILPLALYGIIDWIYEPRKRMAREKKSRLGSVLTALLVLLMAAFIMLVSCQFRFGILVIASPSMTDELNVGDAVVYEAYEHVGEIEENDIIVFTKNGKTLVVHRVIEINDVDGQLRYITKGDANENPDPGYVTDDQITGLVHFKILYIGFPSIWLRELFEN